MTQPLPPTPKAIIHVTFILLRWDILVFFYFTLFCTFLFHYDARRLWVDCTSLWWVQTPAWRDGEYELWSQTAGWFSHSLKSQLWPSHLWSRSHWYINQENSSSALWKQQGLRQPLKNERCRSGRCMPLRAGRAHNPLHLLQPTTPLTASWKRWRT